MGPLFKLYYIPYLWSVVLSIITGILFGSVLTPSGFTSTRKLTGVFYFDDMAVLKVMLTAIVVASI